MVRLFVGGLPPGTTCDQLQQRFAAFGVVNGCHIVFPKTYEALPSDGGYHRGFGYVELEPHDDAALRTCMSAYNGSKWRGHVLRCQVAKPDYMQRLQEEREEGLTGQETALRRKLPPLEPGATLRLRHPSKPATVPVQLESGQKTTSFPPPSQHSRPSSWEPLPVPRQARYTFEARLREVAAQAPPPAMVRQPARDDEGEDEMAAAGARGAAIPMHYSPASSQEWGGGAGAAKVRLPSQQGTVSGRRMAQLLPTERGAATAPEQPLAQKEERQLAQKKRKVVDFMEEDLQEQGGASAALDLSRFASDSEDEVTGLGGRGLASTAAAVLQPAKQQQPRRPAQQAQRGLKPGHPQAAVPPSSSPDPIATAELQAEAVPNRQPAQRSAARPVVEFLTAQDQQQLGRRGGVDLSRFGSDSEDSDRGLEPLGQQGLRQPGRVPWGRSIPQLDGAWDSGESESSDHDARSDSSESSGSGGGKGKPSSSSEHGAEGRGGSGHRASSSDASSESDVESGSSASNESEGREEAELEVSDGKAAAGGASTPAAGPKQPAGAVEGCQPEGEEEAQEYAASRSAAKVEQQAPPWMIRLLPAGAGFRRREPLELIEAAFRVSKEGWAQDYRTKHRQAVRHLSRPAAKKPRRRK